MLYRRAIDVHITATLAAVLKALPVTVTKLLTSDLGGLRPLLCLCANLALCSVLTEQFSYESEASSQWAPAIKMPTDEMRESGTPATAGAASIRPRHGVRASPWFSALPLELDPTGRLRPGSSRPWASLVTAAHATSLHLVCAAFRDPASPPLAFPPSLAHAISARFPSVPRTRHLCRLARPVRASLHPRHTPVLLRIVAHYRFRLAITSSTYPAGIRQAPAKYRVGIKRKLIKAFFIS